MIRNASIERTALSALVALGMVGAAAADMVSITGFEEYSAGDQVMFRLPTFSSSQVDPTPSVAQVAELPPGFGIDGSRALYTSWSFKSTVTDPWLRLTTAGASNLPNPTVDFGMGLRFDIYTDRALFVTLGLRETGTTAAIGQNGGTGGAIEWVGGKTDPSKSPPLGQLAEANRWTTLEFAIPYEPVKGWVGGGNGVLSSPTDKGTLEHLALIANDGAGVYNVYLDNFAQFGVIPEPATAGLVAAGLLLLGFARRRRRG